MELVAESSHPFGLLLPDDIASMIPSIVSRSPSPASVPSPDQVKLPNPPGPAAAQAAVFNAAAAVRPAMSSGGSIAAKLRALTPLTVRDDQVGHKRHLSRDADELALTSGQPRQVPRSAGPEAPASMFTEKTIAPLPLRHAASTSSLQQQYGLEKNPASKPSATLNPELDLSLTNKAWRDRAKATKFWTCTPGEDDREAEKEGLIRMKKADSRSGTGAPLLTYLKAAIVLVKDEQGFDKRFNDHATLIRQDDGSWQLEDAKTGKKSVPRDNEPFIFVTMPDGQIRVRSKRQPGTGHPQVSGNAPYVRFAGEVIFRNGKEWRVTSQSGTYLPPLEKAAEYSGFNCRFTKDFSGTE